MKEKTEMLRYSAIIVDDEAIVREGLVKHFDWKKYSIEIKGCFADGTDAWEFLKNQEIDILITDVKMVRMDGIELTRRAVEKYPNINVLFISGYGDIDYLKNAIKLGAVDYILKSIDLEELAEAMTKITELPSERLIQMGKVSLEIAESIKLPAIIKQWESYLEYLIKEKTK